MTMIEIESRPRLPKEARECTPENLSYLTAMYDFGVYAIGHGCLCLRMVMLDSIYHPEYLDEPLEKIYADIAEEREEDPAVIKKSIEFCMEALVRNCNEDKLLCKYFPFRNDVHLPDPKDVRAMFKFIREVIMVNHKRYYGKHGWA